MSIKSTHMMCYDCMNKYGYVAVKIPEYKFMPFKACTCGSGKGVMPCISSSQQLKLHIIRNSDRRYGETDESLSLDDVDDLFATITPMIKCRGCDKMLSANEQYDGLCNNCGEEF